MSPESQSATVTDLSVYRERRLEKAIQTAQAGLRMALDQYLEELVYIGRLSQKDIAIFKGSFGEERLEAIITQLISYPKWLSADDVIECHGCGITPLQLQGFRVEDFSKYHQKFSARERLNFHSFSISADEANQYLAWRESLSGDDILLIKSRTSLSPKDTSYYPTFLTAEDIRILHCLGIKSQAARKLTTEDLANILNVDQSRLPRQEHKGITGVAKTIRSRLIRLSIDFT